MYELAILLAGIVIGLALAALISVIRRTPVVGGPQAAMPGVPQPTQRDEADAAEASDGPHLMRGTDFASPTDAVPGISLVPSGKAGHLVFRKTTVKREVQVRLEPDGATLSVDGRTYRGLDEIEDPTTREAVKTMLEELPAAVPDPVRRAKLAGELRDLGIVPAETDH
jgi:hypothetical protein